jgi:hypothetical protein
MTDYERFRIRLYQYILFKGDFFKNQAINSSNKVKSSRIIKSADLEQYKRHLLLHELFEELSQDLFNLFDL